MYFLYFNDSMYFLGAVEHPGLLQHKILPTENARRASEAFILSHHEALEENYDHKGWGAAKDCPSQILSSSTKG